MEELSHKNKIREPYLEMLKCINNIDGFLGYNNEIKSRLDHQSSWKVEVKALFELHTMGLLRKILTEAVPNKSRPEGLLGFDTLKGILECKEINCLFDRNDNHKKSINKISRNINKNDEIYHFSVENDKNFFIKKSLGGEVVGGSNYDVNKTIKDSYEKKRGQHKKDYNDFFKVYYFDISPPSSFDKIKINLINENIHENELIVLCSSYYKSGNFYEKKILIQKGIDYEFNFDNKYFISEQKLIIRDYFFLSKRFINNYISKTSLKCHQNDILKLL